MTRLGRQLINLGIALALIPICFVTGCNDPTPPPTQKIATKGSGNDDIVEPPTDDEKKIAQERLDAAIKAHGGAAALNKLNAHIQTMKGLVRIRSGLVQADQEFRQQLPDRLRLVVKGGNLNLTIGIDRGNTWMSDAGGPQDIPPDVKASVLEELYLHRVMTLVPLTGPEFVIRPADGQKVNGRPAKAIRVGSKDHRTVDLFFDAESGLLVRTYHPTWLEAAIEQQREVLLSFHKPFDGVQLPTQVIDKRNGERFVDCTAEYTFVKDFDPKEFARPVK